MPCYAAAPSRHPRAIHFSRFPVNDFAPLFRLFDESAVSRPIRSFQPRFDVREEKDAFHLHGELPGVDQNDIQIEFVDQDTLVIRGKTVRESARGPKPAAVATEKHLEGEKNNAADDDTASDTNSAFHKASVEEEYVDVQSDADADAAATPAASATEVGQPAPEEQQQAERRQAEKPKAKYWISERSVGEFRRSFTFPGHVNQDEVTASLKNGILSVVVPKALQKEPKKIVVE